MRSARLSLALETGAMVLPETGTIVVFRPRADDDLSPLPRERLRLVQGFRPDHDALVSKGYAVTAMADTGHAAALVCVPRAKAEAQGLIAAAVAATVAGAPIWVDGQKTDGVDSLLKELRRRVEVTEPVSKAHGKLFGFSAPAEDLFADWRTAAAPRRNADGFVTAAGVFSADGIDRGSALLAAALPDKLPSRVVDLGAGWGYLAGEILTRAGVTELDIVEAEASALDCARANVTDARARFHWADATGFQPDRPAGAVVCNPPFHTGRSAEPALGAAFIAAAARMLQPGGTLWLVANRQLPYERVLAQTFREVEELRGDSTFKLYRAARPNTRPPQRP